jgi:hypothetical protein
VGTQRASTLERGKYNMTAREERAKADVLAKRCKDCANAAMHDDKDSKYCHNHDCMCRFVVDWENEEFWYSVTDYDCTITQFTKGKSGGRGWDKFGEPYADFDEAQAFLNAKGKAEGMTEKAEQDYYKIRAFVRIVNQNGEVVESEGLTFGNDSEIDLNYHLQDRLQRAGTVTCYYQRWNLIKEGITIEQHDTTYHQ